MIAIILQGLLYDLVSPFTFVPAAAIGWFARTRGQRWAGVAALTVVKVVFIITRHFTPGAFDAVLVIVTQAIAPTVWVFGVAALRARFAGGGSPGEARPSGGRWLFGLLGAVFGAPAGGALGALVGSIAADVLKISAFEGGAGYFVAFFFVIPGILIGLVVGPILAMRFGSKSAGAQQPPGSAP
ncbi:MAG: hypothetical protein FJX57_04410 [Alphaproteobacteria bacterium]|nr:hypothetical protein [Alphaproteobacteria bacterium]